METRIAALPRPVWMGRAVLGEGPIWSARLARVLFTDIKGNRLIAWSPEDGSAREWPMSDSCCWLIERADGDGFIAGLRTRCVVHLDIDVHKGPSIRSVLCEVERHLPGNRLNDAKADRNGNIWFGSMHDAEIEECGMLHRLDAAGAVVAVDGPYKIPNGPAVSPDGRHLYHAETAKGEIYAFDLSPDGEITEKRVHVRIPPENGYPDGMTCDAEGALWVAHWGGGRVNRFLSDGRLERVITLPCSAVTSCTFFGAELDRLAITTASIGFEHEPLAGGLFVADPGVRGF